MRIRFFNNTLCDWDGINVLVSVLASEFEKRNERLYVTKLLKLLFYFDFLHYKYSNNSFTGDVYVRMRYGPVPSIIKNQLDLLKNAGAEHKGVDDDALESAFSEYLIAEKDSDSGGYTVRVKEEKRDAIKKMADYHLSKRDRTLVDELVRAFGKMTVKDIVAQTHRETPYKKTPELEIIAYMFANSDDFPNANIAVPR